MRIKIIIALLAIPWSLSSFGMEYSEQEVLCLVKKNLEQEFFDAAKSGDYEKIALLLQQGVAINAQDVRNGESALHFAAYAGHKEAVMLLLDRGAHINAKDKYSHTPLYKASFRDHGDVVKLLLGRGADIHAKDGYESSALYNATSQGRREVMALLFGRRYLTDYDSVLPNALVPVGTKNNDDHTVLTLEGDHKEMMRLLKIVAIEPIACPLKNASKQERASFIAETKANYKAVKLLVQLCSQRIVQEYLKDPQGFVNKYGLDFIFDEGQTILMLACIFDHAHIISLFHDSSDTFINVQDQHKCSAFDYALLFNVDSAAHLLNMFGKHITGLNPTFMESLCAVVGIGKNKKNECLKGAVGRGNLLLVNALLHVGAEPSLELAQRAQELGYLKVMHRLLFSYLATIEGSNNHQIILLSSLFKA